MRFAYGRKGVEAMLGKIVNNDTFKWILDAYPDRLVALNEIHPCRTVIFSSAGSRP